MSSGLGLKGNVSRCFYYFEDFASCMVRSNQYHHTLETSWSFSHWYTDSIYWTPFLIFLITKTINDIVIQKKSDDPLNQCLALRNDYLECLHHKKEVTTNGTESPRLFCIHLTSHYRHLSPHVLARQQGSTKLFLLHHWLSRHHYPYTNLPYLLSYSPYCNVSSGGPEAHRGWRGGSSKEGRTRGRAWRTRRTLMSASQMFGEIWLGIVVVWLKWEHINFQQQFI